MEMITKMRQNTNKILEMVDDGLLDQRTVILACLNYMSEDEVKEMAELNDFFSDEEDSD